MSLGGYLFLLAVLSLLLWFLKWLTFDFLLAESRTKSSARRGSVSTASGRAMQRNDVRDQLRPSKSPTLRSLVEECGLSVSSWGAERYEWCFGTSDEPRVVTVWWPDLSLEQGVIFLLADKSYERNDTSGSAKRRASARRFDRMIKEVFESGTQVRAIILEGRPRPHSNQVVSFRRLDDRPWKVVEHDARTGGFRLERA